MFCCCIRTFGGAGLKKAQKENLFRHCRRWLSPHPRYLWASGRRQRKVTLPGSELSCRDPLSLARCELLEATEAEPEAPAAELQPAAEAGQWTVVEVELAPAPSIPPPLALEPASPPSAVLELEQGPTSAAAGVGAAELESPGPSLLVGSPSPPVVIKEGEKKPNLTAFPPKLVAEQLTVMDAELFRKVVPSQCLGSTWGKRNKPGNEHLAPTVQATVDHFRRVVSLVVTTCLGDPNMTAQDRARVVEHWIQVAQECEILKNFSSLRAIISALQKTSISHLKNTWADVSRRGPPRLPPRRSSPRECRRSSSSSSSRNTES
ncbi:ral guanine nucleotide dissociation stimulator-like isoform X2 [Diceros bicornis minor]|uniref:ral guanine nucleotide dissociation stimulator-like isoform X2 n=1 Tax=Diceros bicornis minor TaxID=77932 RepID=UPI0026EB2D63|nr:ral guanine nucleotide dissociation stimulator-like isoform X2 [Diceros bicornis minor]XP_058426640.1 ral guanine nucleotide dissociation stimulator-like isoform X2 [Diceros bicornis minor]XP_058426641.1 ral guanine nucleotide dissociation stimulator-like isoform X2 [Diceros bicornis minor]